MSFLDDLSSKLPLGKQKSPVEHFFALNIGPSRLTAASWKIENGKVHVLNPVSAKYSGTESIINVTDQLLDQTLGLSQIEPERILFGVPDSWILDDNLKEENLKTLRNIVRTLELKPMAYVSTSHALENYLEISDGTPPTAILIGIGEEDVVVTVVRAGKVDGSFGIKHQGQLGEEIEKTLMQFKEVEVLPSRILIYSENGDLEKQKDNLLSYPWMSRLSFLHFPKIEILEENLEIKSIALAGAVELDSGVKLAESSKSSKPSVKEQTFLLEDEPEPVRRSVAEEAAEVGESEPLYDSGQALPDGSQARMTEKPEELDEKMAEEEGINEDDNLREVKDDNFGFVTGDITQQAPPRVKASPEEETAFSGEESLEEENPLFEDQTLNPPMPYRRPTPQTLESNYEVEEGGTPFMAPSESKLAFLNRFSLPSGKVKWLIPLAVILVLFLGYFLFASASVTVFATPKPLEKDVQVTADPTAKAVDVNNKIIPGTGVEVDVTGTDKASSTGTKQVGDPAKGTVTVYNKTNGQLSLAKGVVLTGPNSLKYTLDNAVTVASQSATDTGITFGKTSTQATAVAIGPDSNIPSGSDLSIAGFPNSEASAKSEGNFSGGTSKSVTVVTDSDQKSLLASLESQLRKQAQSKLQDQVNSQVKNSNLKVIEESISDEVTKKSYSQDVGDQASNFSLNLTAHFKAVAYSDSDLKTVIGKLVENEVPDNFQLNLADTKTQVDLSKLQPDGKLLFLARFSANLLPKLDTGKIKSSIAGKTPSQAAAILQTFENVSGSDIKLSPPLPGKLARLPFLTNNIRVNVTLK